MKKLSIVGMVVLCIFTMVSCGGGGGSAPVRNFKITGHSLWEADKGCYDHYVGLGYKPGEAMNACGETKLVGSVVDVGKVYRLVFTVVNDQTNTKHLDVVFTENSYGDGGAISADIIFSSPQKVDQGVWVITWPTNEDRNTFFDIDSWLTDSNGITTPVYTFELYVNP